MSHGRASEEATGKLAVAAAVEGSSRAEPTDSAAQQQEQIVRGIAADVQVGEPWKAQQT
jgi:hypothetical protein